MEFIKKFKIVKEDLSGMASISTHFEKGSIAITRNLFPFVVTYVSFYTSYYLDF